MFQFLYLQLQGFRMKTSGDVPMTNELHVTLRITLHDWNQGF